MKLDYLYKAGKVKILIFATILLGLMGLLDFLLGVEISVAIFYLIPISLAAWFLGRNYGSVFAFLSAVIWLENELMGIERYTNHAIPYWNAIVRFGFFMIIVYLLSELRSLHSSMEQMIKIRTNALTVEIQEREKAEVELKNKTDKLSQLTTRLQTIREEENAVISRELHDELGQTLTAMKIEVMWMSKKLMNDPAVFDKLYQLSNIIDDTIKTIRKISTRLRPRLLDQLGFLPAIEWQLKDFQSRTGISCSLHVDDENFDFNVIDSTALFRIFQESITNIARHAKANSVEINIETLHGESLKMSIKDNGKGLCENSQEKEQSLGIIGMKERALILGGNLDVKSVPGGGTEVFLEVPVNKLSLVND